MGRDFNNLFLHDKEWQNMTAFVRKDPYRYYLSRREENNCYHRIKRFSAIGLLLGLYTYRHFKYHSEISLLKHSKTNMMMFLSYLPRAGILFLVTYMFSCPMGIDYQRLKRHTVAKLELQKFDTEYFNYNEYKYAVIQPALFQSEDSVWGRLYFSRMFSDYHQTAGWIKRLREKNPDIVGDVPPKYDFNGAGPRKGDLKKMENEEHQFFKGRYESK